MSKAFVPIDRVEPSPRIPELIQERRKKSITHWPEYWPYTGMMKRCENPKDGSYEKYGGRGISVCERWKNGTKHLSGLECFVVDMGEYPGGDYSLDRIDNDGDYTPGNCRWATPLQQSRNNRNCRMVTYQGKTQSVTEWAEELGVSRSTIYKRLDAGCDAETALSPKHKPYSMANLSDGEKRQVAQAYNGTEATAKEVGERFDITPNKVYYYARNYN